VVACDLEGLSRKDAASQLGWTEGTLSGRLSRARKLLAERLRKAGITCPAVGLATLLDLNASLSAGLSEKMIEVALSSSGIPATVDSLTHGVVQSMFALKLKTAAAAILIACTIGLGAWTAGAGDGPGSKSSTVKMSPQAPVPAGPEVDLARIRSELKAIEQELIDLQIESKAAGGNPSEQLKRRIHLTEEKLVELRRLMEASRQQGGKEPTSWNHEKAITGCEVCHVPGTSGFQVPQKTDPALKDLQGKWKIDSISGARQKSESVMEIVGITLYMPYRESDGTIKRTEYKIAVDASKNPKTIDLIHPNKPAGSGIYEFLAPANTCATCHKNPFEGIRENTGILVSCKPGRAHAPRLRLAIASGAQRPTKFEETEGVIVFQLSRIGNEKPIPLQPDQTRKPDVSRTESTEAMKIDMLHSLLGLKDAQVREAEARDRLAKAQAELETAKTSVEAASKRAQEARARLAALEKQAAPVKPQPLAEDVAALLTVHIRTRYAPEKVVRVKSTGTQTVLEGLAYAAEDMAIKPESVSVWVIRDKRILPVDLTAILKGDSATNYQLKPGDQLFVQVKVEK
jgi:uncharacterized protein (TIGR03067 family)